MIVQPDGQPLRGREAVAGALQSADRQRRRAADASSRASSRPATRRSSAARCTLNILNGDGPDGRFTNSSNSVVIYKRGADGWRIALDAPWGLPQALEARASSVLVVEIHRALRTARHA